MTAAAPAGPARPARRLWWVLGWLVLAGFFAVAAYALPWGEVFAALKGAKWQWALVTVAVVVSGWPLWILEWRLLAPRAHRPSFKLMADVTALTGTANSSVPIAGTVAAVAFLVVRGRLPMTAAVSLYAVDQLLTGLVKVGTLALAAALVPLPDWMRAAMLSLAAVVAALAVGLVVAARAGGPIRALAERFGARPARIARLFADVVDHLEVLRRPLLGLAVALLAVAKKAVEVAAVLTVQMAVGIEPSLAAAVLVTAALGLATLAPISPGNLGIYEAAVIFSYQYLGVPLPLAVAAALVQHGLVFVASFVGVGYLALVLPRGERSGEA